MNIFVTFLTLAAIFASSKAGPRGRITYGQNAGGHQFPFVVGISLRPGRRAALRCGGAIISNNWVITAAHCVENFSQVSLHIGSINFYTPNVTHIIPANFIKKHPDYNTTTLENDIALLHTPDIEYTDKINAVTLPSMRDDGDVENENVIAMGWGEDETGQLTPQNLKFVNMKVMEHDQCQAFSLNVIDNRTLCAMPEAGSNCYGDSGGPLVMATNKMLVGIFSYVMSASCARRNPLGFVRVTTYRDWIKSVSGVYRA